MSVSTTVHRVSELQVRATQYKLGQFCTVCITAITEKGKHETVYFTKSQEDLEVLLSAFNNVIIEIDEEL